MTDAVRNMFLSGVIHVQCNSSLSLYLSTTDTRRVGLGKLVSDPFHPVLKGAKLLNIYIFT